MSSIVHVGRAVVSLPNAVEQPTGLFRRQDAEIGKPHVFPRILHVLAARPGIVPAGNTKRGAIGGAE
jgi:hypothetical protein